MGTHRSTLNAEASLRHVELLHCVDEIEGLLVSMGRPGQAHSETVSGAVLVDSAEFVALGGDGGPLLPLDEAHGIDPTGRHGHTDTQAPSTIVHEGNPEKDAVFPKPEHDAGRAWPWAGKASDDDGDPPVSYHSWDSGKSRESDEEEEIAVKPGSTAIESLDVGHHSSDSSASGGFMSHGDRSQTARIPAVDVRGIYSFDQEARPQSPHAFASARAVGPGKSSSHKANADIDTASGVGDARVSVIDRDASDVEASQKRHGSDTQALHEGASHPVSATSEQRAGTEIKSQQQDTVGAETQSKLAQAVAGRPSSVGRPSPAHSSGSVAAL